MQRPPAVFLALAMLVTILGSATASVDAQGRRCQGLDVTVDLAAGDVPTDGDDVIAGTDGRDIINAGAGNDVICARGDDDSVFGGPGDDVIVGSAGRDILTGSLGNDTIVGGRGRDLLIDGPGDDLLRGGPGKDWCTGDIESQGCESVVSGADGEDLPPALGPPLRNPVLGSGYGMRLHPILGYERMHNGADFRAEMGDQVLAAETGIVVAIGKSGGFGKRVVIDHGGGYSTLYAHLWRQKVSVGDTVNRGDVIGRVGSTGLSTGPHLHFEVLLGRIRLDPVLFFPQAQSGP